MSHDLRSPLTTIRLSVDRLQLFAEGLDPKIAKILGVMTLEAQRLEAIIKAVLDRNRGDSLADQLSLKLGSPREILENLEGSLALKTDARGLRSYLSLDPASLDADQPPTTPLPCSRYCSTSWENALKFTRATGGSGVRSSLLGKDWILEVWDTGRGIPKHQCARLFNPFEQGKEKDSKKGWGLGLDICRSIVEAHGGRIEVEECRCRGWSSGWLFRSVQPETLEGESADLNTLSSFIQKPAPTMNRLARQRTPI